MQEEIWKDITGYEGLYRVSNFGKILSTKRAKTKGGILRPGSNPQGYVIASISKDSIVRYFTVHRLVALAFIPLVEGKDQINHKDGNKKNNTVENLEWCTMSENLKHSYRELGRKVSKTGTGKFGSLHGGAKAIEQFTIGGTFIKEYGAVAEASRETGADRVTIIRCCQGRYKTAGGFIWSYKKQPE